MPIEVEKTYWVYITASGPRDRETKLPSGLFGATLSTAFPEAA